MFPPSAIQAEAAEMELTTLRDQQNVSSLQRTKLQMLCTNQADLITDLQGQLDSMYAAYTMQESEIRSIQVGFASLFCACFILTHSVAVVVCMCLFIDRPITVGLQNHTSSSRTRRYDLDSAQ